MMQDGDLKAPCQGHGPPPADPPAREECARGGGGECRGAEDGEGGRRGARGVQGVVGGDKGREQKCKGLARVHSRPHQQRAGGHRRGDERGEGGGGGVGREEVEWGKGGQVVGC